MVTISKLQVALLADAKQVQIELSELSLDTDTNSHEEIMNLLQESCLVLLRNADYWSHAQANSFSLHLNKAESNFKQLSIKERSKFSSETLTNVNGKAKVKEAIATEDVEAKQAAYIVVTLLVGTTHDRALFKKILTTEALKSALEKLASIEPQNLIKFELLWTPQSENDSLSYEEFLTEYQTMIQLV